MKKSGNKVVIIGTGFVGSTTAYSLIYSGLVSDMVLIDLNRDKASGEVMDLQHSMPLINDMTIRVGDYGDCKGADVIIMTAGPSLTAGETDRLILAGKNSKIMASVMKDITKVTHDPVIIIASNPMDVMTYVAAKSSDYDVNKIIGSGTLLDTSRFRCILSENCGANVNDIHGFILGEHGNSSFAAWSHTNVAGNSAEEYFKLCGKSLDSAKKNEIIKRVREIGIDVFNKKRMTNYGIAAALSRITKAVLRDEDVMLPVSSMLGGEYGISNVSLSLPTVVGRGGIKKRCEFVLSSDEMNALNASAENLKNVLKGIGY